jgi:hypothetical protein
MYSPFGLRPPPTWEQEGMANIEKKRGDVKVILLI